MTTPSPHRPQQARSRVRRELLLHAAAELLAEGGVKAVTHRSVAERAGVPLASTTYYFKSIDELMSEALRRTTERRVDQLDAFVAAPPQAPVPPGDLGRRFLSAVITRPAPELLAQLEVYLEAARNPDMRPTARASIDRDRAGLVGELDPAVGQRRGVGGAHGNGRGGEGGQGEQCGEERRSELHKDVRRAVPAVGSVRFRFRAAPAERACSRIPPSSIWSTVDEYTP